MMKTNFRPGMLLRVVAKIGLSGIRHSPDPWKPHTSNTTKIVNIDFGDPVLLCKPPFKSLFGLTTLAVLHPAHGKICLNFSVEEIKKNLEIVGVDEDDK